MDRNKTNDVALDALFAAGKSNAPTISDELLARLDVDAVSALPKPTQSEAPVEPAQLFGGFKALFAASGLSGAAALGVWIGLIMPDIVPAVSPLAEDTVALTAFLPSADLSVFNE